MEGLAGRYEHPTAAPYNRSVNDAAKSAATDMQKYFGPLRNTDIETFASDAFAHETHNLPRAYVGRNKFLMATIDFLITKDDDWYTKYVLPWLYTEELHVKWNIWRFNKTMMDYEPEQGVPRYVSYESETRSDSLVRRGLAFIIEHGFYKTELGRQHYLMNLKQIVEAVHETVYFGVMHELLASPNFYIQWEQKHGKRPAISTNDAVNALAEERWRFACVQKDIKGLFILDAEIKDRMRRVGIEPDSWVFPSKMAIYASMVPEYFNEYFRGGEKATNALEKGAKRFDNFRGSRVFETRPFDTDFMSTGSIEPLMRDREIGDYSVIKPNFHDVAEFTGVYAQAVGAGAGLGDELAKKCEALGITGNGGAAGTDVKPFRDTQSIEIFDMSEDRFAEIKYEDAIQHAWEGDLRKTVDALIQKRGDATITLGELRAFGMTKADFGTAAGLGTRGVGMSEEQVADLYRRVDATNAPQDADAGNDVVVSLAENDPGRFYHMVVGLYTRDPRHRGRDKRRKLVIPHKLLLFRPRMTYRMGTAILLKGGEELGQTLHGHHDFQLTDDVIHKTHIGHYTFYSKSVVREPKNMYIAEDVYCAGYNGGENRRFIAENQIASQFSKAVDHRSHSIICIPVEEDAKTPACMSIVGDFEVHQLSMHGDENGGQFATSDVIAEHVMQYMGSSVPGRAIHEDDDTVNGLCFRGATRTQRSHGAVFEQTQRNTGHWGPSVYDGCAGVRQGLYAHLRDPGTVVSVGY